MAFAQLLFITNNKSERSQDYPHLHFWFHVFKIEALTSMVKGWKNDQIYWMRIVLIMMCLQFHSLRKPSSKNKLKRERADANLQVTAHMEIPSNELLTRGSHQSE